MGVTFKQKEAQKPVEAVVQQQTTEQDAITVGIVEEMALLSLKIGELKPLEKKYDGLRKTLLEQLPEGYSEHEGYTFEGTHHVVEFSPNSKQRIITDIKKAREALGDELFMNLVKLSLTDMDKYLTSEQKEGFIIEASTGSRICKVKEKLPK